MTNLFDNIERIADWADFTPIPGEAIELSASGKAMLFSIPNGEGLNGYTTYVPVSQMAIHEQGAFATPAVKNWLARKEGW